MNRSIQFSEGEWYHCFNRGVDKRKVFLSRSDYERFLALLYLCNSSMPVHIANLQQTKRGGTLLERALAEERGDSLVSIGAFCLMPNHFHLLIQEKVPNGITEFMRKVTTAYTMYFNTRQERTGALFGGTFKARHVTDDRYFKRVFNYIHANSAELVEPRWKEGVILNFRKTKKFLATYQYSSLPAYETHSVFLGRAIVDCAEVGEFFEKLPTIQDLFEDAVTFAQEVDIDD